MNQKLSQKEKSKLLGILPIDLKVEELNPEAFLLFSLKDCQKYRFIAFKLEKKKLKVAAEDSFGSDFLDFLENFKKINHLGVDIFLASKDSIDYALNFYRKLKKDNLKTNNISKSKEIFEDSRGLIISIVKKALSCGAFKINTEFEEGKVKIHYQVKDLVIASVETLERYKALILEVKRIAVLEEGEHDILQKGGFSIVFDDKKVDLAVSVLPLPKGEKLIIEILNQYPNIYTFENLGVEKESLEILKRAFKKPHGIIFVTGPLGSGRSATMYAILLDLIGKNKKIYSLESPIECIISGINQTQVNPEIGLTFASGLKKILEEHPDLIMIEGMRDFQTIDMVVHHALSDKIFIASLTSESAFLAPFNLIDMGIEPLLVASSINVIVNQKLALRLCDYCKKEQALSQEAQEIVKREIEALPFRLKHSIIKLKFYNSSGCEKCKNTGFKGRIGLFEILELDKDIKDLIAKKSSPENIKKLALDKGMVTLRQDGILKALNGLTTIDEVFRLTNKV